MTDRFDPNIPPAFFSMWQPALKNPSPSSGAKVATNRFFLPPTLTRTIDNGSARATSS